MWAFSVSHSRLLLRCVKVGPNDTRVDVLFKAVDYVGIPTVLDGLSIQFATWDEVGGLLTGSRSSDAKPWRVVTAGSAGVVVAGAVFVNEDAGEYYDPSPLWDD
jgi:hypothetical protein